MEFFEKLQERKLKKAKKELKKQEGKENAVDKVSDKAEKIIAKKYKSVAFIKKMEDKLLKTKVSPEEVKKHRVKLWVIRILKWILQVLEWLVTTLLSLLGVTGILVILIVLVLMLVIYGLLQIDWTISDGNLYRGEDYLGNQYEDCIQGSAGLAGINYDLNQISQLQGTMTPYHQALFQTLSLYDEVLSDTSGIQEPKYIDQIISVVGKDTVAKFLMGFGATEMGMKFQNDATGSYNSLSTRDVLKYPSKMTSNTAGYGFLGLKVVRYYDWYENSEGKNVPASSVSCNRFDGIYSYDGVSQQRVLKADFVNSWKAKYSPTETYESKADSYLNKTYMIDYNYVPYAVATQIGNFATENLKYPFYHFDIDDLVPQIAAEYGITSNIDVLTAYIKCFSGAACYHAGFNGNVQQSNGEGADTGLISLWCALWSATSSADSNRSFNNIKLLTTDSDYTESTARTKLLGKNSSTSNRTMKWDETCTPYFSINGEDINVTLWTWVRDNCSNKEYFESTAKVWLDNKNNSSLILNSHYGLMALIMGNHIVDELGGTVPVVSGGSPEDCDCYEYNSGSIQGIDTSNIKTGEPQGTWSEKLLNVFKSIGEAISKFFGKTDSIENPNDTLSGLGITYEEWRQQSKWKVPYMVQSDSKVESGQNNIPDSWVGGLDSLGNAGCHIYMYSYMASALTGRVINPTEMTVALKETGGISSNQGTEGYNVSYNAVLTFNELGLKAVSANGANTSGDISDFTSYFGLSESELKSTSSETVQKVVDTILSKNGIVGMAGAYGYFTQNTNHYVVITEKTNNGYKVMGYNSSGIYPAPNWEQAAKNIGNAVKTTTGDTYNWEYIYKAMSTNTKSPGYNHQKFYAYNPNLGQTQQNIVNFESFLFIGDSHTVGLKTTLENEGHIVRASSGSTCAQWIGTTSGEKVMGLNNDTITLSDIKPEDINGIVVMLGSNSSTGQENMKTFLDELKGSYPDIPIFVQKVFPLGSNYTAYDVATVNSQIDTFNEDIEEYCNSNDFYFIDTTASLVDSNGFLLNPDSEGIHLTDVGRPTWWSNIQSAVQMKLRTDVVGNINNNRIDCISNPVGVTVSGIGASDLDLDVIDVTEQIKENSWGNSYSSVREPEEIKFIVVHYWGSNSKSSGSAANLISAYKNGNMKQENGSTYMAQYVVDKDGIYRTAPDLYSVWHAGGGIDTSNGSGYFYENALKPLGMERCTNANSIGIEVANTNTTGIDGTNGY